VKISIESSEFGRLKSRLHSALGAAAMNRAIGRGLTKVGRLGKTQVKRQIFQRYNIKSSDIDARLSVTRGANYAAIIGRHLKKTRIPLIKFGAKQISNGVTFRVLKKGKRERLKHAFIQTMPNGYKGVFERIDKKKRAIREKVSIDVVQMMSQQDVMQTAKEKISAEAERVILHELRYELRRAGFR
jgi:hypothetical protein